MNSCEKDMRCNLLCVSYFEHLFVVCINLNVELSVKSIEHLARKTYPCLLGTTKKPRVQT